MKAIGEDWRRAAVVSVRLTVPPGAVLALLRDAGLSRRQIGYADPATPNILVSAVTNLSARSTLRLERKVRA